MWKEYLFNFSSELQHPAWGISHFIRVYELSKELARQYENVDLDCLLAAAYLHDIGAFQPYKIIGIDHAERSVDVAETILISANFPKEKIPIVQDIIMGHMFYAKPTERNEAIIFHDADTLEFMGSVGVARILSIIGLDDWTPDTRSSIKLIEQFSIELPEKLYTPKAKEIGEQRRLEMVYFLQTLSLQTNNLSII